MSGRQVKAAERELSRSRQIARTQRWHVKQRQVSRKYARTVKHEHCLFVVETEQDIEGFEHAVARVDDFHKKLKIILARWENSHFTLKDSVRNDHTDLLRDFDYKGWKMISMYRYWEDGRQGGRFLAFNIFRREVCLGEYYIPSWGFWYPESAPCRDINSYGAVIMSTLDSLLDRSRPRHNLRRRPAFCAPAKEFLVAAQRLVDPAKSLRKLHRVQPEDPRYQSLVALYKTYTLFHSTMGQTLSGQGRPSQETLRALAAWRPREWTRRRIESLVRVQALWRGWHFRQRVLYSPHTDLGRRFLLRTWHCDLDQYVRS